MDDIDMGNEAILRRVATLRVTLGVALQKLLLAGLHVPCSETDRLLDKLNNMLGNAGDYVKARLEKCIAHCNRMWMEDSARQRKSLTDLLCGIEEDDDRVQEKRFPQVVVWTIFSRRHLRCYSVSETMTHLVLPTNYILPAKICSSLRWTTVRREQ